MKKVLALLIIVITVSSCSKQKDETLVKPVQQQTGSFVFYNDTKDTYRVELWRYNSGGLPPSFYTILPGQSMVVANSIAGKWVVGIFQMSGYVSQETRVDYALTTVLDANCFFDWHIQ